MGYKLIQLVLCVICSHFSNSAYLYCLFQISVKLNSGLDHSQPKYSNSSWFAMLFTAGMGIGLMFFGVAEPVMHYVITSNW